MPSRLQFFATCPKGVGDLLADEARTWGATEVRESAAGVSFAGSVETGYRACLWSRVASRILLPLAEFEARTPDDLYDGVRSISWEEHFPASSTLAVGASGRTGSLTHTHYASLKVKDAVVDRFRDRTGSRPSVALDQPDVRINLHLHRGMATVSFDLSGEALHQRGYRLEGGKAPLKENLAAAILLRAGWPQVAAAGGPFVDPMCGSGTLPIEAAFMAADVAPGLSRSHFGFLGWKGHEVRLWADLRGEAEQRRREGLAKLRTVVGYDSDRRAVGAALANVERSGLVGRVHIERREVASLAPPEAARGRKGLVVVNPPYGERLGEVAELATLYAELGRVLRESFEGWRAAVFTGNPDLGRKMEIRAVKTNNLYNGNLKCRLLHFDVIRERFVIRDGRHASAEDGPDTDPVSGMFANRLRKNLRTVGRWAEGQGVSCYRIYDADIPEYNLAVDVYDKAVQVAEYEAPSRVPKAKAAARVREALKAVSQVLEVPEEKVFLKVRRRQRGPEQYGRLGDSGRFVEVTEGRYRFLVNLTDYLDTGLFLDHRPTRELIGDLAGGGRFLNLFCYTGTATVYAAGAGANSTTSVDLSRTYLDWARRNMEINNLTGKEHRFIRADCLRWIREERERYDLIFLDPPTFSTSKAMAETFDVQRDHVQLIQDTVRILSGVGVLLFSNNRRDFKMDHRGLGDLSVDDITARTIPRDFKRNPRIHNCWRIKQD